MVSKKILLIVVGLLFMGLATPVYALNYALSFDGIDDYIKISDSNSLDLSMGMTIEAWIRSNSNEGARAIVSKWNDFTIQRSYILKDHNDSDKLLVDLLSAGSLQGSTSIALNTWVYVAATYDSNYIKLYYNGIEDNVCFSPWTIDHSTADLLIGAVYTPTVEDFSGIIDEVRIWDYARTPQQLQDGMNYSLTGNESGLVGYWNFDEGNGQVVHDLTIYANHGQLGSTTGTDGNDPAWVLSDGQYGQSRDVVPEPASVSLLGLGALGLLFKGKNRLIKG